MPVYSSKSYHPIINYNRVLDRKRVVWPKAQEENEFISAEVKRLLAKEINSDTFTKDLSSHNIQITADPIKRKLRLIEQGKELPYRDVMATITRYKNQNNKIECFEKKMETIKPTIAHKQSESYNSEIVKNKKKLITTPTYRSHKEIYDWDQVCYENALKIEENREAIIKSRPRSQVFNGDVLNKPSKSISRLNPNVNGEGNFIKWAPNKNIKKVEVNLADTNYKKNATGNDVKVKGINGANATNGSKKSSCLNKSIYKYKNDSSICFSSKKPNKSMDVELFRPTSTKNLKLHLSSRDNFLSSIKTDSTEPLTTRNQQKKLFIKKE